MFLMMNILGVVLIALIVWWFWMSRTKTIRVKESVILIEVKDGVYSPSRIEVSENQDITLEFLRKDASSCAEYVVFEALNIHAQLPLHQKHKIELGRLAPGKYVFTCQMQMYRGELIVTPESHSSEK